MIFAREVSDPLTSLVKKIDEATTKHGDQGLRSFVVFLNDEEGLNQKLKQLATQKDISQTVLTIDNPSGPRGFNIAKEADVTVVLYKNKNVKVNYAFKKGELDQEDIDKIVNDLPKILQ